MQNYQPQQVAIRIGFEEMPDGRFYVTSPDLTGFNAVIEPDEDFMEVLRDQIRFAIENYLGTEIAELRKAIAPVSYRAGLVGIPLSDQKRPEILVAAVG